MPRPEWLLAVLVFCPALAHAGFYSVHEPCPFRIKPDGTAEDLSFFSDGTGAFPLDYAYVGNVGDDRPRKTPGDPVGKPNKDHLGVLARTGVPIPAEDAAAVASRAADLARLGKTGDALNLLTPLANQRRPDFRVMATLAHVYALRKEWSDAVRKHESALEDCEFPAEGPGLTAAQRTWLQRVEKEYYHKWLLLNEKEARERAQPQREQVLALFDGPPPADAIAIVQQLLLWQPSDNRLYWLLADLYARSNRPRQALKLYDSLAGPDRLYSNRTRMMEQRAAVKRVVDAMPKETPVDEQAIVESSPPPDTRPWYERLGLEFWQVLTAAGAFAAISALLLFLQARKIRRRLLRKQAA